MTNSKNTKNSYRMRSMQCKEVRMELLLSNLGTLLVGSVVFVGICFAARSVRKEFESGGCSGCSGCSKNCGGSCGFQKQ